MRRAQRLKLLEAELYGQPDPPDPAPPPADVRGARVEAGQVTREVRLREILQRLRAAGYLAEQAQGGRRLVIRQGLRTFDMWPANGRWTQRGKAGSRHLVAWNHAPKQVGVGLDSLIKALGEH